MNRFAALLATVVLTACHGVQPTPTAPDPPAQPGSGTPTRLVLVPSPGLLPVGGGDASVWIEVNSDGKIAPGVPVTLSASVGSLERTQVVTDFTGHATVIWRGVTETGTITANAGELKTSATLPVQTVPVFPPNTPPAPPQAPPAPPPPPPLETQPSVELKPESPSVAVGTSQAYSVSVDGLLPGETVAYYSWLFETGATATTTVPTRSYAYTTHGVKTVSVSVATSTGRRGSDTANVIVTSPLR